MKLLNFLRRLIKDDGFELLDANNKSYIIGKPKKEKPIRLKILEVNNNESVGDIHVSKSNLSAIKVSKEDVSDMVEIGRASCRERV